MFFPRRYIVASRRGLQQLEVRPRPRLSITTSRCVSTRTGPNASHSDHDEQEKATERSSGSSLQQSKFGNLMDSFINSSLNNLEDYLVRQAAPKSSSRIVDSTSNETGMVLQEVFGNSIRMNSELTERRLLNVNLCEAVSLLNPKDRARLSKMSVRQQCLDFQNYIRYSKEHERYDLITLLQLYLAPQEVADDNLVRQSNPSELSEKSKRRMIWILTNFQWFHNASVIISQLPLGLEELLGYINRVLTGRIFWNSSWMKFLFLLELNRVFALKNPHVISQIDYLRLNNGYNQAKLNFMESLIKSRQNRPFAEDHLEREIAAFYKAFNDGGSDPDIECLRLFLMIDLIKHRSPMQPRRQVAEVGELLKKEETIKLFQSQRNFVGSFSRRFLQFSDYEMPQSGRSDRNTLARFIGERKNLYIKVLCTELDRLSPSVIDYFNLMETLPDAAGSWKLYKGYSLGKVHEKEDSFFTPILTGFFAERIFNSDVFLDHEFTRLSIFKKAFILSSEFRQYTAAEDSNRKKSNKHYNRFVYLLDTITDKSELEKVTNMIVKQFFRNSNHLTLRSSLKLMKMMNRVSSPNGISNDSCKAISEYLLLNGANKAFFEGQDPEESVDKLIKCLGLCDKVKVWYFLPVLLNYSRRFHKFEKDIDHDNVARYIFDVYNKLLLESAHDHPSNQKSRHRDYVSGVFLSNKFIMRQTGVELFRSDRALVEYILDRRINWVSRLDPRDCDTFFAPKIGIESIVIEFLVGTYLKSSIPRVSVEDSKLGMDERSFFEIQDLLDAATVRKVYENGVHSDEERTHKDMQDTKLSNLIDAMLDSKDTPANESLDMQSGQEFEDVYSNLLNNATDLELEGAPSRIASVSENDTKTEDFFEQRIKPNTNAGYRALTVDEKLKEMRLYSTLRLKSLMVEEFVSQRPEYVDQLVRKYYEDYNGDIPLTLIHSMMLGILKCKNLELDEKIEKFKNLEKLGALIFDSNKKFHFRIYVRFKDVHIALINAIIDDSLKTNSGSLDILSWGFKKFINTPNVDKYSPWMKEWMKRLNVMREQGSGFWNAEEARSHSWGT